jgi:hypothetical protein
MKGILSNKLKLLNLPDFTREVSYIAYFLQGERYKKQNTLYTY